MALFGRRKPVMQVEILPAEAEEHREKYKEARQRNRLSKPLTNSKITTSASTASLQESVIKSRNPSSTDLAPAAPLTSHPSNPTLRKQIRNEVFDSDRLSPHDALKSASTLSVSQMVKQFDRVSNTSEEHEESVTLANKPKKRKSLLLRRFSAHSSTSLNRSTSKERPALVSGEKGILSPSSSLDRIIDSPAVPATRRASFTPGAATRKPSPSSSQDEIQYHDAIEELEERSVVGPEYFDWQPRPPNVIGRAGTPADLSYSHLAGLRIGSLQVTNGRASPAFSEMSKISKHFLAIPKTQRDVSSEYGDAAEEATTTILAKEVPPANQILAAENEKLRRTFSWESVLAVDDSEDTPDAMEVEVRTKISLDMEDDQTSIMAKEYMAELPASPFSLTRSGSLPGSLRKAQSEDSLQRTPSMISMRRSSTPDSFEGHPISSHIISREGAHSPTGSIIRRPSLRSPTEPGFPRRVSVEMIQPSGNLPGWSSSMKPSTNEEEPVQSAVEFRNVTSLARVQPQPQSSLDKSDSGYSSSNSLRSLQKAKRHSSTTVPAVPVPLPSTVRPPRPLPPTMASELGKRPSILKQSKTEPNVPVFSDIRPVLMSAASAPTASAPFAEPLKPAKQRKKLQKKRPRSQAPGQIALTRVCSFEAEAIPAIPIGVRENLRIRTQEVPELEKTYIKLNTQASSSTMDLPIMDIRFPSPEPQQAGQLRRSRSLSRPRSWISRSKISASNPRDVSGLSQRDALAIINDFDTAASSLNTNPYHIAHENLIVDYGTNSFRTRRAVRPKSMMDDDTAVAVAKIRRRSLQQRDALAERRPSFNDRGGIPGKSLRPASFVSEIPPITQEMLQTVYRTSSMQRQTSWTNDVAPAPPPHSPNPAYVRPVYTTSSQFERRQDSSDFAVAPPPPSHSPRPLDITHDPWAAQAAAWKARRESLGVALSEQARQKFRSESSHYVEEPLYPAILPRNELEASGRFTTSPEDYYPPQYPSSTEHEFHRPDLTNSSGGDYYRDYDRPSGHHPTPPFITHDEGHRGRSARPQGHIPRRPLPEPCVSPQPHRSRPHSQAASIRSHASSLAEELHPADMQRQQPAPEFGRYSGGMAFEYERSHGFGGSAGTRSVSGKAEVRRKGVPLRAGYGVDLGDVPVLSMVRV